MNIFPIVGWFISLAFNASKAVPFWLFWTWAGIGQKFFYFLPEVYQTPGFWQCVGFFICVEILKPALTPKFVAVSQTVEKK